MHMYRCTHTHTHIHTQFALSKPVVPMFSNQMARRFMLMPAAPKMQNHSTAYRKGKGHMTPCLMVHPERCVP